MDFVATNVSVIISFNVSTLKSANIDYGDAIWIDQFVVVVDNQITNVSIASHIRVGVKYMSICI